MVCRRLQIWQKDANLILNCNIANSFQITDRRFANLNIRQWSFNLYNEKIHEVEVTLELIIYMINLLVEGMNNRTPQISSNIDSPPSLDKRYFSFEKV